MRQKISVRRALPDRIGLALWTLAETGAAALTRAAALGFRTVQVDIGGGHRGPSLSKVRERESIVAAARGQGIRISAIAGNQLNDIGLTALAGTPRAARARRAMALAVEVAAEVGAPLVFFPSFRRSEIRDASDLRRTAAALGWACRQAAPHGITVATENQLDVTDARHLLDRANAANLRILLDTFNPVRQGIDVAALVRALGPHLSDQVHLKDGRLDETGWLPLGSGDGRVHATVRSLRHRRFSGLIVLENDYKTDAARRTAIDAAAALRWFGR